RSDIFSFGLVLYEALAGRRPFVGASDIDVMHAILHRPAEPLPDKGPPPVPMIVDKALEKNPADRFQSMADMVVDMRRAVRHTGEAAERPAEAGHVPPEARHRVPYGASAFRRTFATLAIAVIVVAAGGVALW